MASADELLRSVMPINEQIFVANLNTRVISIPASISNLGVESDDDVMRLKFNVPRYYCDQDLSEFKIRINFENSRGNGDIYFVDDVTTVDDEILEFTWLVDRYTLKYKGNVKFNICMKKYDEDGNVTNELNTTYATLPVLEGLETEEAVINSNPNAFDSLLFRLYAVEAATGAGKDGYYSIVKVSESDDGVVFTILNQDGEVEATVTHGKDGHTPELGVEYWTEEEQESIRTETLTFAKNYMDNWSPQYLTVPLYDNAWTGNQYNVYIEGVDSESVIMVSPEPSIDNYNMYTENAIRCVGQGDGYITFQCEIIPSATVEVNVAIFHKYYSVV